MSTKKILMTMLVMAILTNLLSTPMVVDNTITETERETISVIPLSEIPVTAGALKTITTEIITMKDNELEMNQSVVVKENMEIEDVEIPTEVEPEPEEVTIEDDRTQKIFPTEKLSAERQWIMKDLCDRYDLPLKLIMAQAYCESSYDPKAVGPDGHDIGIMQIRDINHEWIEKEIGRDLNFKDYYDNLEAGCWYMRYLADRNPEKDWEYILLCYNRGPGGAKTYYKKNGTCTSNYTKKVLAKASELGW